MSQVLNYLNLYPHMQKWGIYNENGPYTTQYIIGYILPSKFGGLSYEILAEKGNDVYIIQTETFGRCAIWAPRDNDSYISSIPRYSNGNTYIGVYDSSDNNTAIIDAEISGTIKVFIDPGHGGSDSGAVGNGLQEKDINLLICNKLGSLLNSKGIAIKYSRLHDSYVSLEERARQANEYGADLFISVHTNAFNGSVTGTECFTHPNDVDKTKTLSKNITSSISNTLKLFNRGHKESDFAILRLTKMPALLIETAFIDNFNDAKLLNIRKYDFAFAISNEILSYFNKQ